MMEMFGPVPASGHGAAMRKGIQNSFFDLS
jgi:hypothetical protein